MRAERYQKSERGRMSVVLENKLHISDSAELARVEEQISKKKAALLFESGYLHTLQGYFG